MKLTRVLHKIFGINAGATELGVFGSLKAGSPAYATTDLTTIQSLPAWESGMYEAVTGYTSPAMQDVNSALYHSSRQVGYLLQEGVPEYDSSTTYYQYGYCKSSGVIYKSKIDNNLGYPVTSLTTWEIFPLAQDASYATTTSFTNNHESDICHSSTRDSSKWEPIIVYRRWNERGRL